MKAKQSNRKAVNILIFTAYLYGGGIVLPGIVWTGLFGDKYPTGLGILVVCLLWGLSSYLSPIFFPKGERDQTEEEVRTEERPHKKTKRRNKPHKK